MDSTGTYQGIFNQSSITTDASELIITGLIDNKVIGSIGGILTNNVLTDGLSEGSTNKYYTDTRARNAISGGIGINYDPSSGLIANDGVINVIGTTNQINSADDGFGGITLSTPQDIATSSSVQFARILNSSIGTHNVLFGNDSGSSFTGNYLTAIGSGSLKSITSGNAGTAVGFFALYNCNSDGNTALGNSAGYALTTGTNNIFIGDSSGRGPNALTTGTANIYLGSQAYPSATNAFKEIVIGSGTGAGSNTTKINSSNGLYVSNLTNGLLKSTTGKINQATSTDITNALYGLSPAFARILNSTINTINVLVGTNAGSALTTGDANVAVGHNSLASNQTSTRNVAVGMQSLYACIGDFNASCGSDSAFSLTTGMKNSFLGYDSGNGATPLTTGTYNIYLGSEAYSSASNVNREIVIGQGTGKGSNTALINASSGLYVSNLTSGVVKSSATGLLSSNTTTDDLTEGKTNLYYTDTRARGAFSAGTGISITSGVITNTAPATVTGITAGSNINVVNIFGNYQIGTSLNPTFNTLTISAMNDNISNGISLGSSAGTSGNYNTYIGHQAGTSSAGGANVGIGYQALAGAGSNCFGLGFTAGYNAQTNGNICIGNSAGQNLLTGSGYNIYIGGAPSSSSASYETVIGTRSAGYVGKGSNTCYIPNSAGLFAYTPLTINLWNNNSATVSQVEQWVLNTASFVSNINNNTNNPYYINGVLGGFTPGTYNVNITGSVYVNNQTCYPTLQVKGLFSYVTVANACIAHSVGTFASFSLNATVVLNNVNEMRLWYNTGTPYTNAGVVPQVYNGSYLPRYMTITFISL